MRNKKLSGKGAPFSTSYCTVEVTKWSLPTLVGTYCDLSHLYMPYSQPLRECQLLSKDVIYVISFIRLLPVQGYSAKSFLILNYITLDRFQNYFSHLILFCQTLQTVQHTLIKTSLSKKKKKYTYFKKACFGKLILTLKDDSKSI